MSSPSFPPPSDFQFTFEKPVCPDVHLTFNSALHTYWSEQDTVRMDMRTHQLLPTPGPRITVPYRYLRLPEAIYPNEKLYIPFTHRTYEIIGWFPHITNTVFHYRLLLYRPNCYRTHEFLLIDVPDDVIPNPPDYQPPVVNQTPRAISCRKQRREDREEDS